jgi:uncharacterized protein
MQKTLLSAAIILAVGLTACSKQNSSNSQTLTVDSTENKTTGDMKNIVSIVEIPATDFSRAVSFYQAILGVRIEEVDMGEAKMGVLPSDGKTVNVAILRSDDYKPSVDGTIVYLNAGDDLQIMLDKVVSNGGKVVVPKTEISPEMGFFAMFIDSEGNKLGLHSVH